MFLFLNEHHFEKNSWAAIVELNYKSKARALHTPVLEREWLLPYITLRYENNN